MWQSLSGPNTVRRFLLVAVSCVAAALTMPTAATAMSWQQSVPLPRIAPTLGQLPTNCPVVNPTFVHMRRNTQPNSVPPIITWVQGSVLAAHSGWEFHNHRLTLTFGVRTKYGYPQKIFWQRRSGAPAEVALYGWNLRTKQRIWFGIPLQDTRTDPTAPPAVFAWPSGLVRRSSVHTASAPTLTFVPAAGCYVIEAKWRGGSWMVPFAAGG